VNKIKIMSATDRENPEKKEEGEEDKDTNDDDDDGSYYVCLESNPEMLTEFAVRIGMPSDFRFSDCYGLDDDLLDMCPEPTLAVIFLFPASRMYAAKREAAEKSGASEKKGDEPSDDKVVFMRQLCHNACGSIAVIHALANCSDSLALAVDSFLARFLESTRSLSPMERGRELGKKGAAELKKASDAAATNAATAATAAPGARDAVEAHFIALVRVGDVLWELDGINEQPRAHGATSADGFLKDAARVLRTEFLAHMPPDEIGFSILTLGGGGGDTSGEHVECPICSLSFNALSINDHLDVCVGN
jgi:ubiquitin carboxyl-terminal hydrolase L3